MGSVSSLLSSGSFHQKPCKVLESRNRKPSHLQRFIRQQDGLLKFGADHEPVGPSSRLEQTEDFFYINISQTNGLTATGKHKNRASGLGPHKDSPVVKGPPPILVPFSGQLDKAREKSVVRPTAFKAVASKNCTDLNGPLGNQMSIKLELQESVLKPGSDLEKQQAQDQKHTSCSGTLSDSGRNSMSSLPTHSTGRSHGAELNGVSTTFRKNFGGSAQHVGCDGSTLTNVTSDGGRCPASRDPSSNQCGSCIHSPTSTSRLAAEEKSAGKGGEPRGLQRAPGRGMAGMTPACNENQKHCKQGPRSPEQRPDTGVKVHGDYQLLQLQVSQLQQEKQRLEDNFSHLLQECNNLKAKCKTYEREQIELSPKLEEIKWEVCQKSGVIALLKQQLRDAQAELVHKSNEVLTFRNQLREAKGKLSSQEQRVDELQSSVQTKARELEVCENELQRMRNSAELLREKVSLLERRVLDLEQNPAGLKENRGAASDLSSECSQLEVALSQRQSEQESSIVQGQGYKLKAQLEHEKQKNQALVLDFQKERLLWCAEKERVIQYQKQLQQNYLRMHRQNHNLERTIQKLSVQLEARAPVERVTQHADAFEEIAATVI